MNIVKNRAWSFILVTLVYIAATVGGIFLYLYLPIKTELFWLKLLIADVAATAFTFVFSLIFRNASVYDPYWSVQPIVILVAYAIAYGVNISGILLLVAVCFWGVRLTANWAYTFKSLEHQDWRYTMLKEKTGVFYPIINFVGIHLVPTLVVYGCILPAVFAVQGSYGAQTDLQFVGVAIFLFVSVCAATMQGVADIQMHRFRKQKTGGFIRVGLWKYSRHPNYLGEILMWWGVGLACVCIMPDKWYLLAGAVANTLLFLCVSIPMADGRQSKKAGFAEYKAQTRMLLPIKKF